MKQRRYREKSLASESTTASFDSGSGAGKPFLVHRTIARQTSLTACIGQGRFGEVWRATCNGETVAVKIFSSRDGASWARETSVYTTSMLCHPNILAYYASDMISRGGGCTQLWIVTAFHAAGSLHDFLTEQSITPEQALKLARSISAGLAFLHTEAVGKPSIAHRDVKSKNILVMANGEACIADLGLALVKRESWDSGPPPAGPFAGTKRYMAPEILALYLLVWGKTDLSQIKEDEEEEEVAVPEFLAECTHPLLAFEVYLAADVYALGLVLWEICWRASGKSYEVNCYYN